MADHFLHGIELVEIEDGGRTVRTGERIGDERVVAIDAAGVVVEDAAGARSVIGFGGLTRSPGSVPGVHYTNRNID